MGRDKTPFLAPASSQPPRLRSSSVIVAVPGGGPPAASLAASAPHDTTSKLGTLQRYWAPHERMECEDESWGENIYLVPFISDGDGASDNHAVEHRTRRAFTLSSIIEVGSSVTLMQSGSNIPTLGYSSREISTDFGILCYPASPQASALFALPWAIPLPVFCWPLTQWGLISPIDFRPEAPVLPISES
ncbi:hypothetical protein NMY22_g9481 [Coprinellus aureogranulatus]|nr:hypothetical protein NMY22_g9481 [Coprinellus aureogranulatus]